MRWIADVDHVESARRRHIEPMPRCSDKRGASQNAIGIETNGLAFLEKIVVRISIDQRGDVADNQAFFAI